MWDECEKEGGALIKSEPPCTLLYPQLSENLDRQTQGCWPYFDSLGNFKWLNHNCFSKKMPKRALKRSKYAEMYRAHMCSLKWKVIILQSMLLKNISTGSYVWSQNSIIKKRPLEQRTALGLKFSYKTLFRWNFLDMLKIAQVLS